MPAPCSRHNDSFIIVLTFAVVSCLISWALLHALLQPTNTQQHAALPKPPRVINRYHSLGHTIGPSLAMESLGLRPLAYRRSTSSRATAQHDAIQMMSRHYETFDEGTKDAAQVEAKKRAHLKAIRDGILAPKSINYIIVTGDVAKQLGITHLKLRLSNTLPVVQNAPHYEGGNYHLSLSDENGDPFWYFTKYTIVSSEKKSKPPIVAYQKSSEEAMRMMKRGGGGSGSGVGLEPWQVGSHFDFWSKSAESGGWVLSGEDGLKFVAVPL